jgi:hypothetical protein
MSKREKKGNDDLREHYDFDQLEAVKHGPGWKKPLAPAAGKSARALKVGPVTRGSQRKSETLTNTRRKKDR